MSFAAVAKAELDRLRWLPAMRFALVAPAAVAALRIGWHKLSTRGDEAGPTADAILMDDPLATEPLPVPTEPLAENGFLPLAEGLRAGGVVLTLSLLLIGALCVVRDRERGSLALGTLAGSPMQVLASKLLAVLTLLLGAGGLLLMTSIALSATLFELGDFVDEGFVMATSDELWADTWRGFGGVLPGLLAAGCFGLCLSCFAGSTPMSLTATLLPFLFFEFIESVSPWVEKWAFVPYTPFLGDLSTLDKLQKMAAGVSDAYWMDGELMLSVMVPALHAGVYLCLAWFGLRWRRPLS